jgi:hypothetical protein
MLTCLIHGCFIIANNVEEVKRSETALNSI